MLLHSKSFNFIYILFHAVWCNCTQSHSILYTYCSMSESDQFYIIALKVIQFYIHIVPCSLMLLHSKSFNFIYILFHAVWCYCTQSHSILYTYCSMQSDVIALKVIQFYIHIVPCSLMLLHSKSFNFIYILFHAVWCYCTQSHSILYTYCSMQSDVIALKVIQFYIHIVPCSLMLLHSKSFNFIYILFHAVWCYCTQSHSILYTYCSMQSDVIALKVIQFYIHIVPCSLMLLHSKSFNFIYILFHIVWCYCTQSHSILYTYCSMQSDVIALKVIQFYIHIVPCSLMLLHSKSFNFIYILFHAVWCYCTQSHSILYTYCSMQSDVIALKVIQFYIHIVPCSLMLLHSKSFNFIYILFHAVWCYCTQSHSILYTYCSMQSDVIALKVIQFYIHIVPCSLMLLHSKSFNFIYILLHCSLMLLHSKSFNFIYILFHAVWCYCTQSHSILYTYCSMQSDVIALKVIQFYIHIVPCSLMLLHSKSFNFIYILFHAVWCYCTQSHSVLYTYCSMQSDVIALKVIQFYIHIVPCSLMLLHSKSFNFIYILFHAVWCYCTQSHSILYTYCSMQSDVIALKVIQFYIHIVPCSLMSFNFIYILFHAVWCYCTQSHSILYTYCSMQSDVIALKVIQFYIHIVPCSLMLLHSKSFNFIYILFHAVWCYCTQSHSILYTYCSMQSDVIALKVIQFYIHIQVWCYCTSHSILLHMFQSDVIALKVIQFYIHIVPCSLMLLHSKSFNFIYILFHAVWCYCTQSHSILYTYCSMQSDVIALKVIQFYIHIVPCSLMLLHYKVIQFYIHIVPCSLMLLHSKSFNFIYILFHAVCCYCTQSHSVLYTYCSMQSDALKVIQFYIHIVPCSLMLLHSKSFNFIYILFHAVWCNCTQSHSILYTYCSMQSDVIALKVIQFYIHIVPCSLMLLHSKSFNFIYILFHAVWCYCTQSHSILYTYCSMQSDVIALKVIQFYIHIVPCSLMLLHSKSFNFIYILFHAVWCYCTQSHSILYTYCSMQSDVIALKVIQFYIHIVPCSLM